MVAHPTVRDVALNEEFVLASTLVRYQLVEKRQTNPHVGVWYICKRLSTGALERLAHNSRVIKSEEST